MGSCVSLLVDLVAEGMCKVCLESMGTYLYIFKTVVPALMTNEASRRSTFVTLYERFSYITLLNVHSLDFDVPDITSLVPTQKPSKPTRPSEISANLQFLATSASTYKESWIILKRITRDDKEKQ